MARGTGPVFSLGAAPLRDHDTTTCKHLLGSIVEDSGKLYMYVQASAAIAANLNVITQPARTSFDNITGFKNSGSFESGTGPWMEDSGLTETPGAYAGDLLYIDAGTGAGQMKRIISNTATRFYYGALHPGFGQENETDAFATDPDITSDITIISLHRVVKGTASELLNQVLGVAPIAFTSGRFGWICVRGPVINPSGAGLVVGVGVTPGDDTAGYCITIANGETPDDIYDFATALHASTTDQGAPIYLHGNVL